MKLAFGLTVATLVVIAFIAFLAFCAPVRASPSPLVAELPAPPALDTCVTPSAVLNGARPDAFHIMPLPSGVTVMTLWSKVRTNWLTVLFSPRGCAVHSFETPIAE